MRDGGDAQPGQPVFEDVERIDALHDLKGVPLAGEVFWNVLDAKFERSEAKLRCRFLLSLPRVVNGRGGPGYGELLVRCQAAWFRPSPEDTL